jgi:hypothetical protein
MQRNLPVFAVDPKIRQIVLEIKSVYPRVVSSHCAASIIFLFFYYLTFKLTAKGLINRRETK